MSALILSLSSTVPNLKNVKGYRIVWNIYIARFSLMHKQSRMYRQRNFVTVTVSSSVFTLVRSNSKGLPRDSLNLISTMSKWCLYLSDIVFEKNFLEVILATIRRSVNTKSFDLKYLTEDPNKGPNSIWGLLVGKHGELDMTNKRNNSFQNLQFFQKSPARRQEVISRALDWIEHTDDFGSLSVLFYPRINQIGNLLKTKVYVSISCKKKLVTKQ